MSIQDWAAIGEMVGAIAVVVSLIYVGVQLRQNTLATRVITSQAFIQIHGGEADPIVQEPAFRDIYWRGLAGVSNLQGASSRPLVRGQGTPFGHGNRSTSNGKHTPSRTRSGSDGTSSILIFSVIPAFRRSGQFAAITSAKNFVSLWDEKSPARSQSRSTPLMKARTYRDCGEREP